MRGDLDAGHRLEVSNAEGSSLFIEAAPNLAERPARFKLGCGRDPEARSAYLACILPALAAQPLGAALARYDKAHVERTLRALQRHPVAMDLPDERRHWLGRAVPLDRNPDDHERCAQGEAGIRSRAFICGSDQYGLIAPQPGSHAATHTSGVSRVAVITPQANLLHSSR